MRFVNAEVFILIKSYLTRTLETVTVIFVLSGQELERAKCRTRGECGEVIHSAQPSPSTLGREKTRSACGVEYWERRHLFRHGLHTVLLLANRLGHFLQLDSEGGDRGVPLGAVCPDLSQLFTRVHDFPLGFLTHINVKPGLQLCDQGQKSRPRSRQIIHQGPLLVSNAFSNSKTFKKTHKIETPEKGRQNRFTNTEDKCCGWKLLREKNENKSTFIALSFDTIISL